MPQSLSPTSTNSKAGSDDNNNNNTTTRMSHSEAALRKKKNADAQAAFRARRANYIATLEETGSSTSYISGRHDVHITLLQSPTSRPLSYSSKIHARTPRTMPLSCVQRMPACASLTGRGRGFGGHCGRRRTLVNLLPTRQETTTRYPLTLLFILPLVPSVLRYSTQTMECGCLRLSIPQLLLPPQHLTFLRRNRIIHNARR